ncbi:transposase [Patescibacteria group bacterium]
MRRAKKITSKPPRLYQDQSEYFLTFNTYRRQVFFNYEERKLICESILFLKDKMKLQLICFAILPEHVHILANFQRARDVTTFLRRLKTYTTRIIKAKRKRKLPIWQRGTYDRVVRSDKELDRFYNYIVYNPVKHGYVKSIAGWDSVWSVV